ncbi:MAG: sigma-70 family RNA polymerase sigma factor [Planctomycetes bacterium]|nr:sigma-70 family RNA polymerase sigma factor [Planctomycetota bacterium]
MEPSSERFPLTRHSVVLAVRSSDAPQRQRAWERLVEAYWKPVYKYLRLQWRADGEQARDWTQEFFARALEKGFFDRFDPARARFRTFLRVCVDGMVGKEREAAQRQKRGGGVAPLSLDFAAAEGELAGLEPPAPEQMDDYFHREWMKSLFEGALRELEAILRAAGKERLWHLLVRYDLEAPGRLEKLSYAEVGRELGWSVTQVTNGLHSVRRQLRERVLARLRELCSDDDEYRAEARALLGVDPR